jgi:hypothetical protein
MKYAYRIVTWVGGTFLTALLIYVLSYAMLVEVNDVGIVNHGVGCTVRVPTYRMGGEIAEFIYQPMNDIDCSLRPAVWEPKEGLPPGGGGYF